MHRLVESFYFRLGDGSVEEVSRLSGVSSSLIGRWKTMPYGPTLTTLDKVLKPMGLRLEIIEYDPEY